MKTLASWTALAVLAFTGCTDADDTPTDHVLSATTSLIQYGSCSALETDLEDMLIREVWANIERYDTNLWGFGSPEADDSAGGESGGDRQEGEDYSGTNNQEQGVDEADLVKTDGYHIYALNGNRLHIFGVPQFGQLVPESVTPIEGHPREMLIDREGRAVVFSYIYVANLPAEHPLRALTGWEGDDNDQWYWRSPLVTKMTVLDIANRTAPRLVREVFYEGWYQTARKVDSSVRVSTYASISRWETYGWYDLLQASGFNKSWTKQEMARRIRALSLADLIPQMYVRHPSGTITTTSLSTASCQSFYRPTDSHARGIASIISFDLLGDQLHFDADHVVSNWATFYSSQDKILLAEPAHDWWWFWWFQDDPDQLNLHVFDISQVGKSRYVGSGRVEGQINGQFALDEENGVYRVASTTNLFRWWRNGDEEVPPIENHVWTLELQGTQLVTLGHIGGIALGEQITASRFLGDKGYLVTFERTDPLWTLDLSNKYNPRIVGELEIPGFSTYLHPLGPDKLLTIGVGGDENGANWRTTISTFDVSNFAHPTQTSVLPIEGEQGWGWSEALWEHKAFQYFAPKKLLAVPQSNYAYDGYNYRYLSKLEVIEVDDTTGALSRRGSIDHSNYYNGNQYWSYLQIRRSFFMGDYLYAISDKAITVHRTDDLGQVMAQSLPGYTASDWYWWW
ncbi:MAG: beta-propeller domain-containing protein [Kofleriaceae bacterium]|nr:beta-propeller domain-containing protein [Kofleriaceae bacterium]